MKFQWCVIGKRGPDCQCGRKIALSRQLPRRAPDRKRHTETSGHQKAAATRLSVYSLSQ